VSAEPAAARDGARGGGPFGLLGVVLMVLVGAFAFSAMVVLITYAPELESGDNGGAHALSKSAVGFAGAAAALRLAGEPVLINRAPLGEGRTSGLLILTPTAETSRKAVDALRFGGPVLVVAPKWEPLPDPRRRGWVTKGSLAETAFGHGMAADLGLHHRQGFSRPVLRAAAAPFEPSLAMKLGPVDGLQTIAARGWIPVLTDETGAVVLARDPKRPLFVLADPDLINTQGLADADTLAAAMTMLHALRADDGPYMFDVRLNGLGRERTPLRLLFDPPFLAVTVCLALAAALAGWQAFCRFGPAAAGGRVIPLGKTALIENTAALIRLAGREHRMGGRFAELTAELAGRAVGAPRDLGGAALEGFFDRLGAGRGVAEPFSRLAAEAREASGREALARAALRLFQWRTAMTGAPPKPPAQRTAP
jgi:hypothetical protein